MSRYVLCFVSILLISDHAYSTELAPSIDKVINILFRADSEQRSEFKNSYRSSSTGSGLSGKLQADLSMKTIGTNKEYKKTIWKFEIIEDAYCDRLVINVPQKQYYITNNCNLLVGEKLCQAGIVSSGIIIRRHPKYSNLFISKEWSCGSLGCSFIITISCKNLLNDCE